MDKEVQAGCSRPTIVRSEEAVTEKEEKLLVEKKEEQKMIKVGKPAPLFTAPAYHKGEFTSVSLEDYKGKWVLLCFYPGDFTFV